MLKSSVTKEHSLKKRWCYIVCLVFVTLIAPLSHAFALPVTQIKLIPEKMGDWYIDEEGYPIEERCSVKRYFIRRDNTFI